MKKMYEKLEIEVVNFDSDDIVRTSGGSGSVLDKIDLANIGLDNAVGLGEFE